MNILKRRFLSLTLALSFCFALNPVVSFAAENTNVNSNQMQTTHYETEDIVSQTSSPADLYLSFGGMASGIYTPNVYNFTVPASGQYKVLLSTSFASGNSEVTLSITENGNYFTTIVSSGGKIPARIISFKSGKTYSISLYTNDLNSYYAYSGTIFSF